MIYTGKLNKNENTLSLKCDVNKIVINQHKP